jgi:hypothetical protein
MLIWQHLPTGAGRSRRKSNVGRLLRSMKFIKIAGFRGCHRQDVSFMPGARSATLTDACRRCYGMRVWKCTSDGYSAPTLRPTEPLLISVAVSKGNILVTALIVSCLICDTPQSAHGLRCPRRQRNLVRFLLTSYLTHALMRHMKKKNRPCTWHVVFMSSVLR